MSFLAINLHDLGSPVQTPSSPLLRGTVTSWSMPGEGRSSGSVGAGDKGGEAASSTGYAWKGPRLVPGPEVLAGSETGTLTGDREEAVEGAAAQLILV